MLKILTSSSCFNCFTVAYAWTWTGKAHFMASLLHQISCKCLDGLISQPFNSSPAYLSVNVARSEKICPFSNEVLFLWFVFHLLRRSILLNPSTSSHPPYVLISLMGFPGFGVELHCPVSSFRTLIWSKDLWKRLEITLKEPVLMAMERYHWKCRTSNSTSMLGFRHLWKPNIEI